MHSILFVCTGNQHRSPVAAACFNQLLEQQGIRDWWAGSAGTWTVAQQKLAPEVVLAAQALGFDLSTHLTRMVDEAMIRDSALLLVMERGQKEALITESPSRADRIYMLTEMLGGVPYDIPDPILSPAEYASILRELCGLIQQSFTRILERARTLEGLPS